MEKVDKCDKDSFKYVIDKINEKENTLEYYEKARKRSIFYYMFAGLSFISAHAFIFIKEVSLLPILGMISCYGATVLSFLAGEKS